MEIEVYQIEKSKVREYENIDDIKVDDPVVIIDIRITNKAESPIDAVLFGVSASHGPDGMAAESVYRNGM